MASIGIRSVLSTGLMKMAFVALGCAMAIALPKNTALAQGSCPSKLIRIVVPFAPGDGTDIVVRTVGEVMVVRAESRFRNVGDIIAAARTAPGQLSYASQGNGTSAHLAGAFFENLAKLQLIHALYRGASLAITDCLGGQIDMMFAIAAAVGKLVEGGKLQAIAVTTATRSPSMSAVLTIAERGVPGYVAESWYDLYASAGTRREVIARPNGSANLAAQCDAFHKRLAEEGLVQSPGAPEALDRYVRGEEVHWRKLVQQARITTDRSQFKQLSS